ncbi:MAG: MMPL family transporter [Thermomicrobiales bacterium]
MKMNLSIAHVARASARHPWRTVAAWVVGLAVAAALMVTLLGGALITETTLTNDPESARAEELVRSRLGETDDTVDEVAIVRSTTMTVDDPAYRGHVERLYGELTALGAEVVAGGTHYYLTGDEALVSADRRTTLIPLVIPDGARAEIGQVHRVVERAGQDGAFQVLVTGEATLEAEITEVAERDLAIGEGIGLSVALLILTLVLGAIAAAILPMVLAITAIIVALGLAALVGQAVDLPFFVINIITMMGLAVGIDYSLFVVSRYREERAKGSAKVEAIATAGGTAGRTVVLSGLTVSLALLGLLIIPDSGTQMVGAGALLVVVAAVAASVTLLPALLGLMGDKVDAMRIPLVQRRTTARSATATGGFWYRTTGLVMRRPVVSLVLAAGSLLAVAIPAFDLKQGEVGISSLPDGLMSKDAFILLEEEFGYGQDLPAIIVIDGQTDAGAVTAAVARLDAAVAADPAFISSALEVRPEADLTILRAWLAGDPASQQAIRAVERLRADLVPAAFDGVPAKVLVTGDTAGFVDLTDVNETYMPIVFLFVLGLSFILLTVAFRSIVIPIKAILMNLLSVGATYGMLVLVFQKGVGADLLGFQQVEVIQSGLPLFLFAILFGLSMDYHVFLLSRVRERFLETGDNGEAVAYGLRSTGRLITGAALIMVAVFGGFALGDLVAIQQMGFGLAVAVLIDATIIRCILVPASMRLLGTWNWYMPNFLRWLPDLRLEAATPVEKVAWGD